MKTITSSFNSFGRALSLINLKTVSFMNFTESFGKRNKLRLCQGIFYIAYVLSHYSHQGIKANLKVLNLGFHDGLCFFNCCQSTLRIFITAVLRLIDFLQE